MLDFTKWLYEKIGQPMPKQEIVLFHCDSCRKNKPIEELHSDMDKRGFIQKLCNNCYYV